MPKFRESFRDYYSAKLPCSQLRDGDGRDPRYEPKPKKVGNRKALQLAAQVRDILNLCLPQLGDDKLFGLYCDSVTPAPDSSQLLVTIMTVDDPNIVQDHISRASKMLRAEVAGGIHRKKTPNLRYEVVRINQ